MRIGEDATNSMTIEDWLKESYTSARDVVYDEMILAEISRQGIDLGNALDPIELSDDYVATAKKISKKRIMEAGFRLGELLEILAK